MILLGMDARMHKSKETGEEHTGGEDFLGKLTRKVANGDQMTEGATTKTVKINFQAPRS